MRGNGVRGAIVAVLVSAAAAGGTAAAAAPAMSEPAQPPAPAFTNGQVTNPWFPLKPGTRMVYQGVKDGKRAVDVFYVTRRSRTIQGVVCRVVRDRLRLNGALEERTVDWYAQSRNGAVWYFGERSAELGPHGHVITRDGSWMAGRHGARAGVYITAAPADGQARSQEHYRGHAQDHFRVMDTSARVAVPLVRSSHAVLTKEWTPLEPAVVDHKYYLRDVGMVSEQSVKGPKETGLLVSITGDAGTSHH